MQLYLYVLLPHIHSNKTLENTSKMKENLKNNVYFIKDSLKTLLILRKFNFKKCNMVDSK